MADVNEYLRPEVGSSFEELTKTAKKLNCASDALTGYVRETEDGIKALGLGVTAWVTMAEGASEDGQISWEHAVGYTKVGKNWCIALTSFSTHNPSGEVFNEETWPFNEAPRGLRVNAVKHLPALLKKLNEEGQKLAREIDDSLKTASEISSTVTLAAAKKEGQKR